jgi:mono/diheme cytochrome c family protein
VKRKSIERVMQSGIVAAIAGGLLHMHAQQGTPKPAVGANATVAATPQAVQASHEDPVVVKRGGTLYEASCASCHGNTAKGTDLAPDLIRSVLVEDDDKGDKIGPLLKNGHTKGAKSDWTDQQIRDIAAWLCVQVYGAAFRQTYTYANALVGDPKKGEVYFQKNCASCHSATGDLAGIGGRYDVPGLQFRWLTGGGTRSIRGGTISRGGSMLMDTSAPRVTKSTVTITVTLANGQKMEGVPVSITDFNVSFRDMTGQVHSIAREGAFPKVVTHNPLQPHEDLLKRVKNDDMHDVTAYLVTLK